MKAYGCHKCGSTDIFIKQNGSQTGLYCSEGCGWLKWVSKKELPLVEEFISRETVSNKTIMETTSTESLNSEYGIMTLKDYLNQKKWEYENIDTERNSYNKGLIKGIEASIRILESKKLT